MGSTRWLLFSSTTYTRTPPESLSWCFDCFADLIWATSQRSEGMARCKISHDATATRLDFCRSIRRVLGLRPHKRSALGVVGMYVWRVL